MPGTGPPVGDVDRSRRSAPAAARAWSPARPRTTSRSSARAACCSSREMHWLRIDRYFDGDRDEPDVVAPADAVPALRERAVRVRLPGQRDGAQPRRAQRDGLQPLRRHAVLLEQLPVQGPPLQLVRLAQDAARQPALACSQHNPDVTVRDARRDGEVHVLRAAHPRAPRSTRAVEQRAIAAGRGRHRVPAGVPDAGDRVRLAARAPTPRWRGCARRAARYAVLHELGTRPRTRTSRAITNPNPELA